MQVSVVAVLLSALCATALADITVSRQVTKVAAGSNGFVKLNTGCSSSDQYGSNDCDLKWGSSYSLTYNVSAVPPITGGYKISIDLKVDKIIPFKADCPACGANCTLTVPVINKKYEIAMPPCPLKAYSGIANFTLPDKDPVPASAHVEGTVTITDPSGATVDEISINVDVDK